MFKKIRSFVFCFLAVACTGLSTSAMNESGWKFYTPEKNNCKNEHGDKSLYKEQRSFVIDIEKPIDYAIIHFDDYLYLNRPLYNCFHCGNEFKYEDEVHKDECVVFIPFYKNSKVENILDLISYADDVLCFNCMCELLRICRKYNAQFNPKEFKQCSCVRQYFDLDDLGWGNSVKNLKNLFGGF